MRYVNIKQAAKHKGVGRPTIYKAIADGKLRLYDVAGYKLLNLAAVDKWEPDPVRVRAGKMRSVVKTEPA